MTETFEGNYPIETRSGELERLLIQSEAMAPGACEMLDRIGVGPGWHTLDIGCGPGGITGLMSDRVGPSGHVTGLDRNDGFLEAARKLSAKDNRSNVTFKLGDAYNSGLDANSFDLVHMRFVASTAGGVDRLLKEAIRLAKPGGIVALQEPDGASLNVYPPSRAWDQLRGAILGAFDGAGADLQLARRLYWEVRQSGLSDVQFRPFIIGVRSGDAMADYLPSTALSLRGTILKLGLMTEAEFDAAIAECRAHLAEPGTSFTMYTVAQVWGRKAK